jgi:hypothetical protein
MNLIQSGEIIFFFFFYHEKKLTGVMKRKVLGEYNNKVRLRTARRFNVLPLRGLQPDLCCFHG